MRDRISSLRVKRGDSFTAELWNRLLSVIKSMELRSGPGVLLSRSETGVLISFRPKAGAPPSRWKPTLTGDRVIFGLGLVSGLEPRLDDRPISGILPDLTPDPKGQPSLKLDEKLYDATGTSWLAIRCRIDEATGRIIQPDEKGQGPLDLTIVQTLKLSDEDSTYGFHRIALLRRPPKETKGFGRIHQIAKFDYQHRTSRGNKRWRHFFDPA